MDDASKGPSRRGLSRDLGAGIFLLVVATIAYFSARDLPLMDGTNVGPGFMPKSVALLIAVFGYLTMLVGLADNRILISRWSLRGIFFVLGAVVVFGAAIRPLGLVVAGPVAVIMSALADPDSRPVEIIAYAAVMSVICIGLFKYMLRLPIPLAPLFLGY